MAEAEALIPRYQAIAPERHLRPVLDHLPNTPSKVLDVGAGTGDVALWLADLGHTVTAVEPVASFRAAARSHRKLNWYDDRLPALASPSGRFDLILLLGVWHHLSPAERRSAALRLAKLLGTNGRLILSVRHGPTPSGRPGYAVPLSETADVLRAASLRVQHRARCGSIQPQNQALGVDWDWLVLGHAHIAA